MKNAMIALALVGAAASAQAGVNYSGGTYTENFDGLPTTTQTALFPFSGQTQVGLSGTGWAGAKLSGTGSTNMNLIADTGSGNSGGIYSYAAAAAPADRALGSLGSGSNVGGYGVEIVNTTGGVITQFTITFDREQYRSSTLTTNTISFAYGVSGGSATSANFLSDASLTANTAGDLVGDAFVTTNGVLAPPSIITNVTATITLGTPLPAGGSLYLRWSDKDDTGNDAGIAIDNFRFSAVPTPGALALLGMGGLVAARRKR